MIDPVLLRTDPDRVRASQAARGESLGTVDAALAADGARREALQAFESLRAEQNVHSKLVAQAPKEEKAALVAAAQDLAARVKAAQQAATETEAAFDEAA